MNSHFEFYNHIYFKIGLPSSQMMFLWFFWFIFNELSYKEQSEACWEAGYTPALRVSVPSDEKPLLLCGHFTVLSCGHHHPTTRTREGQLPLILTALQGYLLCFLVLPPSPCLT